MTFPKCTECGSTHPDFDFDLTSGFTGVEGSEDPTIGFVLREGDFCQNHNCEAGNVFIMKLEDLLRQTVLDSIPNDYGEGSHRITKLLRDYADKIDAEAIKYKHEWDAPDK